MSRTKQDIESREMPRVEAHGMRMPALGFGTWNLKGGACREAVEDALAIGYRHLDTAQMYENEKEVGAALEASGVSRDDVFLTTKVWRDRMQNGALQESVEASLGRLGCDHVDLLLLHWPNPEIELGEALSALADVVERGWARHVGVSNFPSALVDEAVERSDVPIACDQVEYHPFLSQAPLRETLHRHGIALTAYCPLAHGQVAGHATLEKVGRRHGKNAAQVALRWLIQQEGVAAIPKAASAEHRRSNFEILDFALSDEEMETVGKLRRAQRLIDPDFAPDWD